MADDYTQSLREKFDLLIVERSRLQLDVEILTEENKKLREEVEALRHDIERHQKIAAELATENEKLREKEERFQKLDAEAANYVETVICMRTHFTGEPPYVGWQGLGLALREALDERDRLREAAEMVAFHYFNCEGQCGKLRQAVAQLAKASGYSDRAVNDEIEATLKGRG